jgi:glycosyltransferase involved in cell wall biosynthesis
MCRSVEVSTKCAENAVENEQCMLSVIVPIHNEEKILEPQALELIGYIQDLTEHFEILLVENGSTDKTFQIARELQRRFNFIRLIKLSQADYSTAVIEGIKRARGEYSIIFGIDFVDLEVLKRCFQKLKHSDIVICSKNLGFDGRPFLNRLANKIYNIAAKTFLGLKHSDVEGYHGYNTKKIQALLSGVKTKAHLCNIWILAKAKKANLKVDEVPMTVYEVRKSRFMKLIRLPYLVAISLIEIAKIKTSGY